MTIYPLCYIVAYLNDIYPLCYIVTDLNDNAPVFENSTYHVEISDQVTKGQFVAMVAALDIDECNEGELMYK